MSRRLVRTNAEQARVTQLAVHRPFDEADLRDHFGTDPVRAHPRQAAALRERRLRDLHRVQPGPKLEQQLRIESRSDLAREDEIVLVVVPDEQRAQSDAPALRIREAADDELLRRFAFHLEPVGRAPVLVRRAAPLRDDAFPAFAPGTLPRLPIVERRDALKRRSKRQRIQQRAPLFERQPRDVAAIDPHDVEHVVRQPVGWPRDLSVQHQVAHRQVRDRLGDWRRALRQPVARQQPHVAIVLEGDQADAVELPFENPIGACESLLRERRGHRFDPLGERHTTSW